MTTDKPSERERFRGCLLGGAVGDALGAAVEFMKLSEIRSRFGAGGIRDYAPAYGGLGRITDDTQMTLFTAEGLLRGAVRHDTKGICHYPSVVANAYLRWLVTQGFRPAVEGEANEGEPGWLFGHPELHSRRAPGNTCLSALRLMRRLGEPADNNSKGCGGVMRVAPVGLFASRSDTGHVFQLAVDSAALTHGHPTGSLSAGVLAVLVQGLVQEASLPEVLETARHCLASAPSSDETLRAIDCAQDHASRGTPADQAIRELGEGWIAEDALAVSIYCALVATDFREAIVMAVNHDGDSDSTGAITGNLLGAQLGVQAIPAEWLAPLELREVITEMADDLLDCRQWSASDIEGRIWDKYPGF